MSDPVTINADVERIDRAPAAPALDARDFDWLINQYLEDRRTKVDAKTAKSYACRLRIVIEWWCGVGPTRSWQLRASDLEAFERYLRVRTSASSGKPLAYTYRFGILQSLREVLHWACENGYTKNDRSSWVPAAFGVKKKRRAANEIELLHLLAECDNSPRRVRDRAIIAMFIGMGLRCSEVSNLKVEDVEFQPDQSGYVRARGKRTKANPTGERDAAFEAATGKMIAEHIATRGRTSGSLFVSYRGYALKPYTLYGIVKKLIGRAGLENQIQACHDLRRAFATHHVRNSNDPQSQDILRRQLGHAKYSQTAEYTLIDIDDIRRRLTSPLAGYVDQDDEG